jgi:hypothetical protein
MLRVCLSALFQRLWLNSVLDVLDAPDRGNALGYMETDFMKELEEQTHPEILRSNLGNTVLELVKLGIKVCLFCLIKGLVIHSLCDRIWSLSIMLTRQLQKP